MLINALKGVFFGGPSAKSFNPDLAQALLGEKVIQNHFQPPIGPPRVLLPYEANYNPDLAAKMTAMRPKYQDDFSEQSFRLFDFFPSLEKDYPDLEKIQVSPTAMDEPEYYDSNTGRIKINPEGSYGGISTLAHETQHGIDDFEGFFDLPIVQQRMDEVEELGNSRNSNILYRLRPEEIFANLAEPFRGSESELPLDIFERFHMSDNIYNAERRRRDQQLDDPITPFKL